VTLAVAEGSLPLHSITLVPGPAAKASSTLNGRDIPLAPPSPNHDVFTFADELTIHAGEELVLLA
jgi:hypothetical protein